MADESRALRNLRQDLANASYQLRMCRAALADDDSGTPNVRRLFHWFRRRGELLDRLAELTAHPEGTAQ
jgi:hypothetical protein